MFSFEFLSYLFIALGGCIALQFLLISFRPFRPTKFEENYDFYPFVSVVIPCKGTNEEFELFVQSLRQQDYHDIEYIFAFADPEDPGITSVKNFADPLQYKICIAEPLETTCGMSENMIAGLKETSPDSEVVIFIDADGVLPANYLRSMIAPLADEKYIVSSTFRKYQATSLGGIIAKYWNYVSLYFREWPGSHFPWGGAMAFRRKDLAKLEIPDCWYQRFSDDMPLVSRISKLGKKVCLIDEYAISTTSHTVKGALKWIRRSNLCVYHYAHQLRRVHLIYETLVELFILAYFVTGNTLYLLPLASFFLFVTFLALKHGNLLEQLLSPWTAFMLIVVAIWSSITMPFMRKIEWAGIEYNIDQQGIILSRKFCNPVAAKKTLSVKEGLQEHDTRML